MEGVQDESHSKMLILKVTAKKGNRAQDYFPQ